MSAKFADALRDFAWSTAIIVLPPTIVMGFTFPATAALLGDETGTEGSSSGALVAVNTTGAIVATFVLPFFVIPLIGSPTTLALLAIVNVVIGGLLLARADLDAALAPDGRDRRRGRAGRRDRGQPRARHGVHQPDHAPDRAERRRGVRGDRGRDRARRRRPSQLPAAVGQRHVDDADHRRHQVHAAAAADAPTRGGSRARDRVRHGHGVPDRAPGGRHVGRDRARAVRPEHVPLVLRRRGPGAGRPERARSSSPTAGTTWS